LQTSTLSEKRRAKSESNSGRKLWPNPRHTACDFLQEPELETLRSCNTETNKRIKQDFILAGLVMLISYPVLECSNVLVLKIIIYQEYSLKRRKRRVTKEARGSSSVKYSAKARKLPCKRP